MNEKYSIQPGTHSHEAESFYPKALRGIGGIRVQYDFQMISSEPEDRLLRWVLLDAKAATGTEAEMLETYQDNKALFDQTATDLTTMGLSQTALGKKIRAESNGDIYTNFHRDYVQYANAKIAAEQSQASAGDRKKFGKHWRMLEGDYDTDAESPVMQAEKARDFSMFQHIMKAKQQGYHLFGLGELHRKRLAPLLNKVGIKHKFMDNFIAEQKSLHPQP